MNHVAPNESPPAARVAVTLQLDAELVRTAQSLHREFVRVQQAGSADKEREIDEAVRWANELYKTHGLAGEEYLWRPMAQFDVHPNPTRSRANFPYLVVVQSRRLDSLQARLVAPLQAGQSASLGEAAMLPTVLVLDRPFR